MHEMMPPGQVITEKIVFTGRNDTRKMRHKNVNYMIFINLLCHFPR
ncbi:hypothetical protein GRAQ_00708 [Rahnella aquatilis CIP 78.65 = ATCC 33071]|uniref:Uncharacterized protein n=1 Tax=Rahnella aquatilis (strain ATCC 33071 / DSM 4594 / JCM 1683 / NBRC 105701 / NCIMB 13365 / CIP 78.65) TaxID=745277 RepID=H2IT34_RAHAC|nr:hypothetical protein Rahaq2_1678 [Rahnella aquatilis CIP 78.65 = ATCC 33071]KFD17012.1 hypothetical protein GRAQ_00708 [Rahnella aquatilis CIP 78.65 = ATCC 33071]